MRACVALLAVVAFGSSGRRRDRATGSAARPTSASLPPTVLRRTRSRPGGFFPRPTMRNSAPPSPPPGGASGTGPSGWPAAATIRCRSNWSPGSGWARKTERPPTQPPWNSSAPRPTGHAATPSSNAWSGACRPTCPPPRSWHSSRPTRRPAMSASSARRRPSPRSVRTKRPPGRSAESGRRQGCHRPMSGACCARFPTRLMSGRTSNAWTG